MALPAPLPQTNNYGGGGGSVNCGAVGGQPFSQTAFMGSMSGGNSISLNLSYSGYPSGASQYQSVIGSALLNLPSVLQTQNPYGGPPQQVQSQFCVTSSSLGGGQPSPGTFVASDSSVAMMLYGYVQSPVFSYNPYDPYSSNYQTGSQYQQLPATVSIGQSIVPNGYYDDCGARLINGRVQGCVEVKLGNYGQPKRLWFQ